MQQPAGVILAGGQSRRMGGGDKSLRLLGGRTILSHVMERLEPQVCALVLNANGDGARFDTDMPVIVDTFSGFAGPLAGVLAGLDWAAENGHSHIVTAAADTPFFPCDLVPRLLLEAEQAPIVLAATPDPVRGLSRHPTFGLWPTQLREDLRQSLQDGVRKVLAWTDRHGTAFATFDAEPFDPFFNINTPEDMIHAEAIIA